MAIADLEHGNGFNRQRMNSSTLDQKGTQGMSTKSPHCSWGFCQKLSSAHSPLLCTLYIWIYGSEHIWGHLPLSALVFRQSQRRSSESPWSILTASIPGLVCADWEGVGSAYFSAAASRATRMPCASEHTVWTAKVELSELGLATMLQLTLEFTKNCMETWMKLPIHSLFLGAGLLRRDNRSQAILYFLNSPWGLGGYHS